MDKRWTTLFSFRTKKVTSNSFDYKLIENQIKFALKKMKFQKEFKIFNIVGTNGKGSVSSYLAQGLKKRYKKVGLFLSPHICKPNERISINGKEISDKNFFKIYDEIQDNLKETKLNFFAYLYIVALIYFQRSKCDIALLEAGIGGKYDTTNIVNGDWGVVTSVALDHIEMLGNTIEKIAIDKAGIMNKNMRFFIPTALPYNIQNLFIYHANSLDLKYFLIENKAKNYNLRNSRLASLILYQEFGIEKLEFDKLLGRTSISYKNNFNTILDVAHNISGIIASLNFLKEEKIKFERVVITISKSKDISEINDLFKRKEVLIWKPNKNFYDNNQLVGTMIDDPKKVYEKQNKNTLYIGSFRLIGQLC